MSDVQSGLVAQVERVLVQIECLEGQSAAPSCEGDRSLLTALRECRRVLQGAVAEVAEVTEGGEPG